MDICTDMRVDMYVDTSIDICIDMCMDMCIGMCIDVCIDVCIDLAGAGGNGRASLQRVNIDQARLHVHKHVCRHVYRDM